MSLFNNSNLVKKVQIGNDIYDVIFETIHGSKMYGTASENSDTDIKGIFLPTYEQLYLGKFPKSIKTSTSNGVIRCNKDDVEKEYYSLHYFLDLACEGQTIAIDMLFGPENVRLYTSPLMNFFFDNKTKFLTKKLNAILGYATGQAIKYSNKGNTLQQLKMLHNEIVNTEFHPIDKILNISDILISFSEKYPDIFKIRDITKKQSEQCFVIDKSEFSFNAQISVILESLDAKISKYGKRTLVSLENNGTDYKALYHAIRCIQMAKEIMLYGTFTYPLKNNEFIIAVKNGKIIKQDIINYIDVELKNVNQLIESSIYPEKVDRSIFNEYLINIYMSN